MFDLNGVADGRPTTIPKVSSHPVETKIPVELQAAIVFPEDARAYGEKKREQRPGEGRCGGGYLGLREGEGGSRP